jgi:FKBP-type peptidyl-prolyl cis-trans isomerase
MRRLVPVSVLCLVVFAACGDDSTSGNASDTTSDGTAAAETAASCPAPPETTTTVPAAAQKPDVQIPATTPTELVITDLVEGTGEPAKDGDTISVNYVGVRSATGEEFDNSYDRGTPFTFVLGRGGVIKGWDQGLVGMKAGGRRQLDIPAELAYGDSPQGDVIQAGDALTFVVEAVSIAPGVDVPKADPADKPQVDVPTSKDAKQITITDLAEGDGPEAKACQTAYVQVTAYRGDTGEELDSTWKTGVATEIPLDQRTIPGFVEAIVGMKVGGRRLVILPPADAFGAGGNETLKLPANTDLILVFDLVQVADPQ